MGELVPNHSTRAHAVLSASGSHRWLNCTPSARLEEHIPSKSSIFADEGTLAHEISEILIREKVLELSGQSDKKDPEQLETLKKKSNYYDGMIDDVQPYVDYVINEYKEGLELPGGVSIFLEEKLDLTDFVPDAFGTGDTIIIKGDTLEVVDLKFGKGVRVSAIDNSQLKLYGLGALNKYEMLFGIKNIILTIAQPRLNNIESWSLTADELMEWGTGGLTEKAIIAFEGEGNLNPGSWCKFCKVKAQCRALADKNMELAKFEFKDPKILSDDELLEIYHQRETFSDWLKGVQDHIYNQALGGKKWKGLKIVEGRANRSWVDPNQVIEVLTGKEYGLQKEVITDVKLKGLGEITKIMGKAKFEPFAALYTKKPKGVPSLVLESDPRPEASYGSAAEDFEIQDDFLD